MTPDEYQQQALRTENTPEIFLPEIALQPGVALGRLVHGMIGACTETGELQDMIKKFLIYGKPFDRVNVLEECGDVLWYLAIALSACGFTMEECMQRNIEKLRKRFPDKFTQAQALVRDLDAERAVLEAGQCRGQGLRRLPTDGWINSASDIAYDNLIDRLREQAGTYPAGNKLTRLLFEAANALARACGRQEKSATNPMWVCFHADDANKPREWHRVPSYDCAKATQKSLCGYIFDQRFVKGASINISTVECEYNDQACMPCLKKV